MVRVGRHGLVVDGDASLELARRHFDENHWVRFPGFLDADLLARVQAGVERAEFRPKIHGDVGAELCMVRDATTDLLAFVTNDRALFRVVDAVTGVGDMGCFHGRVYRMAPSPEHHDDWHDDLVATRLVAMSVNLGPEVYEGGCLELRERSSGRVAVVPNVVPGDALVFRLSEDLQHHITNVTGSHPKTAYAGWFRREPDFREVLAGRARF